MNARGRRLCLTAPLAALLAFAACPVLADMTKDQCIDANGKGQELRREGKLSEARDQLRACANAACPAMVRDDCTKRLDELERAQPTIAFEVKDASGADVSAVKVTVDGKLLAAKLDGTMLPVDIGEHLFAFEVPGKPPLTRALVLTEGEKGRREQVMLGAATTSTPASVAPPAPPRGPASAAARPPATPISSATMVASPGGAMGTQKVLGLIAGGVGVAVIGVGRSPCSFRSLAGAGCLREHHRVSRCARRRRRRQQRLELGEHELKRRELRRLDLRRQ